jgi:hypothetical protein
MTIADSITQLGRTDLVLAAFYAEAKHKFSELWEDVTLESKNFEETLRDAESTERVALPNYAE